MCRLRFLFPTILVGAVLLSLIFSCAGLQKEKAEDIVWRGVHIRSPGADGVPLLKRSIVQSLAPMGVNVIILEVNYDFEFDSHPGLRGRNILTKKDARELTELCRQYGIRLIPLFNCLGHQSWAKNTFSLLEQYPEFDETPRIPDDNPDIYCRSWCPLHPQVNEIVFALMDDMIEAFDADAFHVGMDEVFLIGSDQCPRCRGKDPAELFAKAVNDYHRHLVKKHNLTMLMWGDRLLDDELMGYGKWEASQNETGPAIDLIPNDIIMCDWHYELRDAYPSIPYFQEKGFRVWPSSWWKRDAALALLEYGQATDEGKVIGHLCTTWVSGYDLCAALLGEDAPRKPSERALQVVETLRACMERLTRPPV